MDGCSTFVVFGFSVAAFIVAMVAKQQIERIRRQLADMQLSVEALQRELAMQRGTQHAPPPAAVTAPPVAQEPPQPVAPVEATPPAPPIVTPVEAPPVIVTEPAAAYKITTPEERVDAAVPELPVAAAEVTELPPPPPPPPPVQPPAAAPRAFDWESLVGVKLFSWIAGIALALAGVFFLKYSVDHGWLTPTLRVIIGLLTGVGVIAICEMRIARNYRVTANAMHGAGIAILYATLFAAHSLWKLVPQPVVFVGMVAVTALAVFLSARRDSVFIALLGLLGGFATPALLSTGENRPIALFGYLLLLNLGIAWIAYKRRWPVLSIASAIFTFIYQWAWVAKYLTDAQMPLAAGIFGAFAIAGGSALWTRRADASLDQEQTIFERIGLASAVVPLFFAVFAAAVPAYGSRYHVLFAFLLLISAGLAVIAILRKHAWLNTIGGIGALLTFAVWLAFSYAADAWPAVMVWAAVAIVLHLAIGRWLPASTTVAALLLFVFPVLASLEPLTDQPTSYFAAFFVLASAVLLIAAQRRSANAFALASIVVSVTLLTWPVFRLSEQTVGAFLILVSSLVLLQLAAVLRVRSREGAPVEASFLTLGVYFSLMYVAGTRAFAEPAAPLLAALTVIALGCGIAALLLPRVSLASGVALLTPVVLVIWTAEHGDPATAALTMIAASVVHTWAALTWFVIARRERTNASVFPVPVLAGFGSLVVILVAEAGALLPPSFSARLTAEVLVAIALLAATVLASRYAFAPFVAVAMVVASLLARDLTPLQQLIQTGAFALLFTLFPLLVGRRMQRSMQPYVAAIIAHVVFLFAAVNAFDKLDADRFIGLLPVVQAAIIGGLLLHLLRFEPSEKRVLSRLALVAGAVLAFVTVAIPLQFEREWLTLGWVLLAAALLWLYRRVPHRGLLVWSGALYAIVFARLVLNSAVFTYHPRTGTPLWNWYLYAYVLAAAAFFVGTKLLPSSMKKGIAALATGGTVLLFVLVNIEIADFYSTGATLAFNFFSASLAEDLSYTMAWALFAIAVLVAGIVLRNRSARIAALALLALTILKCFIHDLGRLGGLYRVGSLLGLAASLVVVGLLIQRFVITRENRDAADPA